MVSASQVLGLALACAVLLAVRGPSALFVVGRALSHGREVALLSVVGNCLGCYAAAVCVAIGPGPLLQSSEWLFHTVKLLGAAYLVWLGVRAWRHARGAAAPGTGLARTTPASWPAISTGVVVGLTNAKAFIVFAAVLPQFVDRDAGHVAAQMLLLGAVPVLMGAATDTAWGLAAGRARSWLAASPRRMAAGERTGGLLLIGLGVSVATTGRQS